MGKLKGNNLRFKSLNQLPTLWDGSQARELFARAQKAFEKKSGWKSAQVKAALSSFSRLNGVNKALFGGLLIGQALIPPTAKKGARKTRSQSARA